MCFLWMVIWQQRNRLQEGTAFLGLSPRHVLTGSSGCQWYPESFVDENHSLGPSHASGERMNLLFGELSSSPWTGAVLSETISNSTRNTWMLRSTMAKNRLWSSQPEWRSPDICELMDSWHQEMFTTDCSWKLLRCSRAYNSWARDSLPSDTMSSRLVFAAGTISLGNSCWQSTKFMTLQMAWWLLFSSWVCVGRHLNCNGVSQGLG